MSLYRPIEAAKGIPANHPDIPKMQEIVKSYGGTFAEKALMYEALCSLVAYQLSREVIKEHLK